MWNDSELEIETESEINLGVGKVFEETPDQIVEQCTENSICDLSFGTYHKTTIAAIRKHRYIHTLLLNNNYLENLELSFTMLTNIKHLNLSQNLLTYLPANFGDLNRLHTLILHNNSIVDLPDSFAQLTRLSYLDLQGNPFFNRIRARVGNCETPQQFKSCALYVVGLISRRARDETEKNIAAFNQERDQTFMRTNHSLSAVIRNDGNIYLQGTETTAMNSDTIGPRKMSSFVIVLQDDASPQQDVQPASNVPAIDVRDEMTVQNHRKICIISLTVVVTCVTLFLVFFSTGSIIWKAYF
ncbi:uncharacterized protein LOC119689532 [Teleopsis dalmanni]|uniref:uncharacterized protein LOC119689532 n=1 Tax=Teleopsis dalmanni TaxID=139649 RepID=UPI0018CEAB5F|nr:uncharacterized protein LOC119689532 [Teleopsis dalmanni]